MWFIIIIEQYCCKNKEFKGQLSYNIAYGKLHDLYLPMKIIYNMENFVTSPLTYWLICLKITSFSNYFIKKTVNPMDIALFGWQGILIK